MNDLYCAIGIICIDLVCTVAYIFILGSTIKYISERSSNR